MGAKSTPATSAEPTEWDDLSCDELEAVLIQLSNDKAAIRERQLAVHAVYDRKAAEARAVQLVETLSDAERAALVQTIEAQGIASTLAVGDAGSEV